MNKQDSLQISKTNSKTIKFSQTLKHSNNDLKQERISSVNNNEKAYANTMAIDSR